MKTKEKNKLIPKLRFPEFKISSPWEKLIVRNYFQKYNKKIGKDDTNEYKAVAVGELGLRERSKVYKSNTIILQTIENYKIFPYSSICFGLGSRTLAVDVNDIKDSKFVVSPAYKIFSFDSDKIHPTYLKYYISHIKNYWGGRLLIQSARQGKSIDENLFFNLYIPIPSLPEQQKIADFLSNLDDLIEARKQKLELLKRHKKGLMQNLFPQEGEKVPKLRFPEFKDSGEWEEKKIEEVCKKPFSGGTPSSTNENYYDGNIPFIRSAEINKEETELSITELGLNNSSAKLVKKGDILVAMYGANSGDVAISKINGAINQAILCLRSKSSNEFLSQYLKHKKEWIKSKYLQGGQGNLSSEIIKSIKLLFPKNNEQKKIASCLSSLDDLIEAEDKKIKELEKHKKGLMQGLFPEM